MIVVAYFSSVKSSLSGNKSYTIRQNSATKWVCPPPE